jgi:hypothetical protein
MVYSGSDSQFVSFDWISLHAQIELISVPQEFARLCNAVLGAQYGNDFLPIDDDRPDRGNDGYLKSEKRLFAVHCFKRLQKQGVDDAVQSKMVGDLGKAVLLKQEGIWEIKAWTFLCNYPINEVLGTRILRIGREADIDVSWKGPHFLAEGLQRYPEVWAQFPDLQVNEVSERLDRIQKLLSEDEQGAAKLEPPDRVPQTAAEHEALLAAKPEGWEFLLFAGVLLRGKSRLERRWNDHQLPPFSIERRHVDPYEAPRVLSSHFQGMLGLIQALNLVFNSEAQRLAFGGPGEAGDSLRIEQFGERIIETYEGMLDLTAVLRSADVPEPFVKVQEVAMRVADQPLGEIRDFIDDVVEQTEKVPAFVANPDPNKDDLQIHVLLTLSVSDNLVTEYSRELERAEQQMLDS